MVYLFASDELAIIKTEAVVKKEFDVAHNQFACMLINGMMQFLFPKTGVVHDQYISADESFDLFHHTTAMHVFAMREAAEEGYTNFSWGISTENHGNILNENLYRFKESFGAKGVVNVTYAKKF